MHLQVAATHCHSLVGNRSVANIALLFINNYYCLLPVKDICKFANQDYVASSISSSTTSRHPPRSFMLDQEGITKFTNCTEDHGHVLVTLHPNKKGKQRKE